MKKFALALAAGLFIGCSTNTTQTAATVRAPSASGDEYPIEVIGGDEASFTPASTEPKETEQSAPKYDVIIVGAGLSGLTSAVYLTENKVKVLLLEKEAQVGGLAAERLTKNGIVYDRGAAYWTAPFPEELEILKHIELGNYEKLFPIPEPIDTYLHNGKLYGENVGIWAPETVKKLPVSFEIFKYELQAANADAEIPNQPFEEFQGYVDPDIGKPGKMVLDTMTAAQWINEMPKLLARHAGRLRKGFVNEDDNADDSGNDGGGKIAKEASKKKPKGRSALAILRRFLKDPSSKKRDPMRPVREFLDLYCRSALGATADQVSAMAFANFYISEIDTRYTTPLGTGKAARNMWHMLRTGERKSYAEILTSAAVPPNGVKLTGNGNEVAVTFVHDKETHVARANYVIYAAQLKFAPGMIQKFKDSDDPKTRQQAEVMSKLDYSHYSVHAIEVDGHPYRASYDTWVRTDGSYKDTDFTDIILGRWNEKPLINGYEKSRDNCSVNPDPKRNAIVTIYHPIAIEKFGAGGYSDENAKQFAREAVNHMRDVLKPVLKCDNDVRIKNVETNRWPYSVHVARPGHYSKFARLLRRPVAGRIFFANNNLGTPAFEEALFRGHCAADNVLARMNAGFKREDWSRCPIDK